jgi:hypothetical protein
VLADYRRYMMPVKPLTVAVRGIYFGRFGRDAESERLPSLYIGYPGLVRGYDPNSFQAGECGNQPDGSCPSFDRLQGSRVAIGNVELRMPLWSLFGGQNFYGPLPVEVAVFGDGGVAWNQNNSALFIGDNKPVTSVGTAIRANLFGFAVAEIDFVRPLQRERGWIWQFSLMPGF